MTHPPQDTMPDTSPGPPAAPPSAPSPARSGTDPAKLRDVAARRVASLLDTGAVQRDRILAIARALAASGVAPSAARVAQAMGGGITAGQVENTIRTVRKHPELYPDGWPRVTTADKVRAIGKRRLEHLREMAADMDSRIARKVASPDPEPLPLPVAERPAPRLIPARVGVTVAFLASPDPAPDFRTTEVVTPIPPDLLATLGGPGAWEPYPEGATPHPLGGPAAAIEIPDPPAPVALRVPLFADDEIEALARTAEEPGPVPPTLPEPPPCPAPSVGTATCAMNPPSSDVPATTAPSNGSAGSAPSAAGEPTSTADSGSCEAAPTLMGGPIPGMVTAADEAAAVAEPEPSPYVIHDFLPDPTPDPAPPKATPRSKAPPKAPRPAPKPPALSPAAREILDGLPSPGSPGTFRFPMAEAKGAEKSAAKPARPVVVELELTPVERARRDAANGTDDKSRLLSLAWNIRDAGRFPTDLELSRRLNVGFADVVRLADELSDAGLWLLRRKVVNRPVAALGVGGGEGGGGRG